MDNKDIPIRECMSSPVYVVAPDTTVSDAYSIMMCRGIRRLPVVTGERLVGIVTLGDLREARPAPAGGASIYELTYLLARLTVAQVMSHAPFTVTPDTPLHEAARLMLHYKVGGLPVIDGRGRVVGLVTESDIFKLLTSAWDNKPIKPAAHLGGWSYPLGADHLPATAVLAASQSG
jgi:CBS domain-containing protein